MQWAIWMIEGEKALDTTHASYGIVTWATTALPTYNFAGQTVKVINLYTDATKATRSQDQLMIQSPTTTQQDVPEPTSLMLLGFGADRRPVRSSSTLVR